MESLVSIVHLKGQINAKICNICHCVTSKKFICNCFICQMNEIIHQACYSYSSFNPLSVGGIYYISPNFNQDLHQKLRTNFTFVSLVEKGEILLLLILIFFSKIPV